MLNITFGKLHFILKRVESILNPELTGKERKMFVINKIAGGLADCLINRGNFPLGQVEINLRSAVEEIKEYISKELWFPIIQSTFHYLICVSAYLPPAGIAIDILKDLDPENKFPIENVRSACYREEYSELIHTLEILEKIPPLSRM